MECSTNCYNCRTPTPPQTTKQSQTRVWRGQKQRQCPLSRVHPLCSMWWTPSTVSTCPSPSVQCVPWCPPQSESKCRRWTQLPVSSLPLLDNGMARVKVADRDKCRSRSVPITFNQEIVKIRNVGGLVGNETICLFLLVCLFVCSPLNFEIRLVRNTV